MHFFATGTGESNTLSDDVKAKYGVFATGPVFDEWMAELRSDARAKYGSTVTDNVFPSVGVTGVCVLARRGGRTVAAAMFSFYITQPKDGLKHSRGQGRISVEAGVGARVDEAAANLLRDAGF